MRGIGSFMKGPRAPGLEPFEIDLADDFPEGQNAIEAVDIQKRDFLRTRVRPVVGIMKQSDEMKFVSESKDDVNTCRRLPFVHDHHIGISKLTFGKCRKR